MGRNFECKQYRCCVSYWLWWMKIYQLGIHPRIKCYQYTKQISSQPIIVLDKRFMNDIRVSKTKHFTTSSMHYIYELMSKASIQESNCNLASQLPKPTLNTMRKVQSTTCFQVILYKIKLAEWMNSEGIEIKSNERLNCRMSIHMYAHCRTEAQLKSITCSW